MTALIDSTEMHLRTLYELREEGVPSMRARVVERLRLSAPSVSETTARLAADGLVEISSDRTVHLTEKGLIRAAAVMRKHRLAELLLTEVIGLEWRLVHNEACRWEHVISDAVSDRLTVLLGNPQRCPHGNAIPPAVASDVAAPAAPVSLLAAATSEGAEITLGWMSESLQTDEDTMRRLQDAGVLPGARLAVSTTADGVRIHRVAEGEPAGIELAPSVASVLFVAS
ncbi:MAG: metal-dependent transcriptional regulator [Frankiaceae bacterium]